MTLRRRSYLVEATYEVDRKYRDVAMDFYESLLRFLEKKPDDLEPLRNGGFSVRAPFFWRNPLARNLAVVFQPQGGAMAGGIGKAGHLDVLVFSILKGPGDKSNIDTRLSNRKDAVVHEMIHFLDPGREKQGRPGSKRYSSGGVEGVDYDAYYNDPSEWNAFWQEGARKYEYLLTQGWAKDNPKFREMYIGNGTLSQAYKRGVPLAWDKDFLAHMNRKTKRKFDKRFAELWRVLKKKGAL